jgi:tRNA (guanine-N7-)-methyltransferase
MTPGQQRAFEAGWSTWGLDFQTGQIDLAAIFGNDHPVYLEIGFGNGEALLDLAQRHPQHNFIGIEVHAPGVGHLLRRLGESDVRNVRVIRHDAVEVIDAMLPERCLAGVFLFFPDPWHKKRHHKRRLVQPAFVDRLARILAPGGLFHAATDWEDYARQMMDVLSGATDRFDNTAGVGYFAERPDWRLLTRFEQRGQRLGHGVWDLIFRRRP